MSYLRLPCENWSKPDGNSLVKPLHKLFEIPSKSEDKNDELSRIEHKNVAVSENTLSRREQRILNLSKIRPYRKKIIITGQSKRRNRLLRGKVKDLENCIQQLMEQNLTYRNKTCHLQRSFCELLHVLRRNNELWKMIHVQKVSTHANADAKDLSDACSQTAIAKKIRENATTNYVDGGDAYSNFHGKGLSKKMKAKYRRKRTRYINYLISGYQESMVTVAKENNDLKSTYDVLSAVNMNLQKEVRNLQNMVHGIDLSKPVPKTVSELTPKSVPCEAAFTLEVQKHTTKRTFMTPLPGFLDPVVKLKRIDRIATLQNSQLETCQRASCSKSTKMKDAEGEDENFHIRPMMIIGN